MHTSIQKLYQSIVWLATFRSSIACFLGYLPNHFHNTSETINISKLLAFLHMGADLVRPRYSSALSIGVPWISEDLTCLTGEMHYLILRSSPNYMIQTKILSLHSFHTPYACHTTLTPNIIYCLFNLPCSQFHGFCHISEMHIMI